MAASDPKELGRVVPAQEKQTIVRAAIGKFRLEIHNLETVLYGLAEDTLRAGTASNPTEILLNELCSQSAIYIATSHALKTNLSDGNLL
ncbi:Protein HLB1 [Linum perenne]